MSGDPRCVEHGAVWGGRPFLCLIEWLVVLDERWLLDLGILRPTLLQLNDAERNRTKPYKEKQNANDLFIHELGSLVNSYG